MHAEQLPDSSWTSDDLVSYAIKQLKEELNLGRRTLPVMFRAGMALTMLKASKAGTRAWVKTQKDNKFARTTVNHSMRLYDYLKDREPGEWADLTITQAKVEAGIIRKATPDSGKGKDDRRRYVLPRPNAKNALNVADSAIEVLALALSMADHGDERFGKLVDAIAQLGKDVKKSGRKPVALTA